MNLAYIQIQTYYVEFDNTSFTVKQKEGYILPSFFVVSAQNPIELIENYLNG